MLQLILSVQMGSQKTFGVVIDNFQYQLDIKRRFVSKSILGTVVIKSMKYDGYTYSQVATFIDEQWNGRKFCNSKYIASTHRL